MTTDSFLARQPIIDKNRELYAYELLYRSMPGARDMTDGPGEADSAAWTGTDTNLTANVLLNTLHADAIGKVVGKLPAFVNCSREFFFTGIADALNPAVFVLEILESVEIDDELISLVAALKKKGFRIAADDFVPDEEGFARLAKVMDLLSVCKLEWPAVKDAKTLQHAIGVFHGKGIQVLAEKVETEADFDLCQKAGVDLFQGYFYAKPEVIKSGKLDTNTAGVLQLMKVINSGNCSIDRLDKEFKSHPDITANLLKYINSAAFGIQSKVTSIRQALTLLGVANIRRWLLILSYGSRAKNTARNPVLANAVKRATFFESFAKKLGWPSQKVEESYLAGLISHLDVVFQMSLGDICEQMAVDRKITDGLLTKEGDIGHMLNVISLVEQGDFGVAGKEMRFTLSHQDINDCLDMAYEKSLMKDETP